MRHMIGVLTLSVGLAILPGLAAAHSEHAGGAEEAHGHGTVHMPGSMEEMREMHRGHQHHHDFEAMERMSPEEQQRMLRLMADIGLAQPPMDPAHGRELFVQKGCVACHSVNGVGGDIGPALDAHEMPKPMNAFEFAARMWRGAPAMVALQEDMLGAVISLDGQDLADLVAFAHDEHEQEKLTDDQVPEKFRAIIDAN